MPPKNIFGIGDLVRWRNGDDLLAVNALVKPPSRSAADPGQGRHKRELTPASVAGCLARFVVVLRFHRGSITEMKRARFPDKHGCCALRKAFGLTRASVNQDTDSFAAAA